MKLTTQWSPELATGIDIIDQQHQRLILCLDEVSEAIESGDLELLELVVQQLIDFCCSHNDFEEALMQEAGYPLLEPHRQQHAAFRLHAQSYAQALQQDENPLHTARHILSDLAIWVTSHIQHEDQHYVPWIKRHLNPGLLRRMRQQLFTPPQRDSSPSRS